MICRYAKELLIDGEVIREKKTVNKFGYTGIANNIRHFLYEDGAKTNGKKKHTKKELEQFLEHILLRCEDHSHI